MYDICIETDENSVNLASIGETLGGGGVNIFGLSLARCNGRDIIHLAVKDAEAANNALQASGIEIKAVTEVYVLDKDRKRITGKPGNFGSICRALANNGIGISFGYPAEDNRYIFGVDDLVRARALLG